MTTISAFSCWCGLPPLHKLKAIIRLNEKLKKLTTERIAALDKLANAQVKGEWRHWKMNIGKCFDAWVSVGIFENVP